MPTPYVRIEVKGGVAYVVRKTKGAKVVLLDFDNHPKLKDALIHAELYRENEEI